MIERRTNRARRLVVVLAAGLLALAAGLLTLDVKAASPVVPGGPEAAGTQLEALLDERRRELDVPGLAVTVVQDGTSRTIVRGRNGNGDPVTADSPFLIGSGSKVVTAYLVRGLAVQGRVELARPVRGYLPEFRLADREAADQVTVRQLLTHASGLSTSDGLRRADRFDDDPGALQRAVASLADAEPNAVPGERYQYSDANYLVLGRLVEVVTGLSFAEATQQDVFAPLGMTHSAADRAGGQAVGLPPGHRLMFGAPVPFASPVDTSGAPYGYLAMSAPDYARFATAALAEAETAVPDSELGWVEQAMDGLPGTVRWKGGATPGYSSSVLLVPERQLAVVVLMNVYSPALDAALMGMAADVARLQVGSAPRPASADRLLLAAPWVAGGLAVATAAAGIVVATGRGPRPLRWRLMLIVAGLVLAGFAAWVPATQGADWRMLRLWTPDLALTLAAGMLAGAGLAAAEGLRLRRRE